MLLHILLGLSHGNFSVEAPECKYVIKIHTSFYMQNKNHWVANKLLNLLYFCLPHHIGSRELTTETVTPYHQSDLDIAWSCSLLTPL